MQIFDRRFVKCRDLGFARAVHREKAPTMAHHYLWGSKALNIANNTISELWITRNRYNRQSKQLINWKAQLKAPA